MLLAVADGLGSCTQEVWAIYAGTVERLLGLPPERMLFCGVAIGTEKAADPANRTRGDCAPVEEWLTVRG